MMMRVSLCLACTAAQEMKGKRRRAGGAREQSRIFSAGFGVSIPWRGIREVHLTDEFKDVGVRACALSTTRSERCAAVRLVRRGIGAVPIEVPDALGLGDLHWVSAFPGDAEVLYPPLTFLRPTHRMQEIVHPESKVRVMVIEVTPDLSAAE